MRPPTIPRERVKPWTYGMVAATRASLGSRYAAMVDVGDGVGLRHGEIIGLALDDVDFARRVAQVRRQVKLVRGRRIFAPFKGGKTRDGPLPDSRAEIVSAPLKGEMPESHREHGMHALRHFYASVLLDGGGSIKALSEYLGHPTPASPCARTPASGRPAKTAHSRPWTTRSSRVPRCALYQLDPTNRRSKPQGPTTSTSPRAAAEGGRDLRGWPLRDPVASGVICARRASCCGDRGRSGHTCACGVRA